MGYDKSGCIKYCELVSCFRNSPVIHILYAAPPRDSSVSRVSCNISVSPLVNWTTYTKRTWQKASGPLWTDGTRPANIQTTRNIKLWCRTICEPSNPVPRKRAEALPIIHQENVIVNTSLTVTELKFVTRCPRYGWWYFSSQKLGTI